MSMNKYKRVNRDFKWIVVCVCIINSCASNNKQKPNLSDVPNQDTIVRRNAVADSSDNEISPDVKELNTDSLFITMKSLPGNDMQIEWGDRKNGYRNISSDTFMDKFIFLKEIHPSYLFVTQSQGTGAFMGIFLPRIKGAKEHALLCPVAVDLNRGLVAHIDITESQTLGKVTNLNTNTFQIFHSDIGQVCESPMNITCIDTAYFTSENLIVHWHDDSLNYSNKNHIQKFRLQ